MSNDSFEEINWLEHEKLREWSWSTLACQPLPLFGSIQCGRLHDDLTDAILAHQHVENEIMILKDRLLQCSYAIAQKKVLLARIRSLPLEILSEVFSWLLHSWNKETDTIWWRSYDYRNWVNFKQLMVVCKAWYQTILSTPALWRMLTFHSSQPARWQIGGLRQMKAWVERSGSLPLQAVFHLDEDYFPFRNNCIRNWAPRFSHCAIELPYRQREFDKKMTVEYLQLAVNLRNLVSTNASWGFTGDVHEVVLELFIFTRGDGIPLIRLPSLKKLDLGHSRIQAIYFPHLASTSPLLESLRLIEVRITVSPAEVAIPSFFPHLSQLRVMSSDLIWDASDLNPLLFTSPQLRTLAVTFRGSEHYPSKLPPLNTSNLAALTEIIIELEAYQQDLPSIGDIGSHLLRWLECAHSLRSLHIHCAHISEKGVDVSLLGLILLMQIAPNVYICQSLRVLRLTGNIDMPEWLCLQILSTRQELLKSSGDATLGENIGGESSEESFRLISPVSNIPAELNAEIHDSF